MMAEGEDTLDSWEDLEDSGELDKRLEDFKPKIRNTSNSNIMPVVNLQEESGRTSYQPQVKILKRQVDSPNNSQHKSGNVQAKPYKSLQQREAEYAEARMRIMGSVAPPDESDANTSPNLERPSHLIQQVEGMKVTDNVVRLPKGPDGSKGFSAKR